VAITRSRTALDAPVLDRSLGSMAEQRTTNASGLPVASDEQSLTVGPNGPTVLQDAYVVQKMQHFNRERVPERVVHAKGSAGAHLTKGENMSVEEILATHRRPLIADVATLAACIDECAACAATCTICADACLAEPDIAELARCVRICLDCADTCVDTGRILSRQTDPDADTQLTALKACLAACHACAAECERHAHHHEHCRLSAEECRRCERACDDLLAALGST
jgi:hypothetical protein